MEAVGHRHSFLSGAQKLVELEMTIWIQLVY